MAIPGFPGGYSSPRETHLFPLKGHLWPQCFQVFSGFVGFFFHLASLRFIVCHPASTFSLQVCVWPLFGAALGAHPGGLLPALQRVARQPAFRFRPGSKHGLPNPGDPCSKSAVGAGFNEAFSRRAVLAKTFVNRMA